MSNEINTNQLVLSFDNDELERLLRFYEYEEKAITRHFNKEIEKLKGQKTKDYNR